MSKLFIIIYYYHKSIHLNKIHQKVTDTTHVFINISLYNEVHSFPSPMINGPVCHVIPPAGIEGRNSGTYLIGVNRDHHVNCAKCYVFHCFMAIQYVLFCSNHVYVNDNLFDVSIKIYCVNCRKAYK